MLEKLKSFNINKHNNSFNINEHKINVQLACRSGKG